MKESEIITTSNLLIETSELNIISTNELKIIRTSELNNINEDTCLQCSYDCYRQGKCSFDNNETYEDIYETIKSSFISSYNGQEGFLSVSGGNNFNFQLTTIDNELNTLKENIQTNFSVIDLKDCADLLKSQYSLDNDTNFVILKYENTDSVMNGNEKSVQYEVYLPNSDIKLNLSVCSNTNIDIYVPIELSEETQKLYGDLKSQGYDLFDKNNKFYKDICTPYKSENGTDVLLADRYNDFFIPNQLECQSNCEYSDYLPESHYLKCECNVVDEEKIETEEPEKLTMKSIGKSFYNVLKYSNYKVLICYKLVFRKVTIRENVGSILSNLYFIGFLIGLGIFCYRKLIYLKIELEKLFDKQDNDMINNVDIVLYNKNKIFNTENNVNKIKDEENNKNTIYIKKVELNSLKENRRKKSNVLEYKEKYQGKNIIEKTKDSNRKLNILENNYTGKKIMEKEYELSKMEKESKIELNKDMDEKNIESDKKKKEDLTDYELNDLDYAEAIEKDNRNFFKIYFYLLKREHLILFSFFNWNDFNFFSIKLSKFFLSICTDMAFNVFFFSDESMHNIYTSGGEHDFIGQLAQMVYSTIVSQVLQIFINYLTMSDIHYYQIKELSKEKKKINSKEIQSVIKCIKIKLIAFYISMTLLFLFFWYLISAFCAVYANTQRIFVTDSISSFIMGLIYPFIIYLAPTALRFISLKAKEKKNLQILYSLSDKIPIF